MKTFLLTFFVIFLSLKIYADQCTLCVTVYAFQPACDKVVSGAHVCVCKTGSHDCSFSGYTNDNGQICFDNVPDIVNWDIYAGDVPPYPDCLHAYLLNYHMDCTVHNNVSICFPPPCMHSDKNIQKDVNQPGQLKQNYPNPFNPTTEISYTVATPELVKITVYDLTGKKVAELVNEYKDAGTYSVDFDASELSSGLYFYKLETVTYTETRKMLLIK